MLQKTVPSARLTYTLEYRDGGTDPGIGATTDHGDRKCVMWRTLALSVPFVVAVSSSIARGMSGWPAQTEVLPCAARQHPTIMQGMGVSGGRRTQLLRGVLDLCLLAVMGDDPAYGYEMTKRLGERGLSIVGEGSIYPLLGRLERDGLVDTHRAASNGGPPRKYYRLSRQGRLALEAGTKEWQATRDAVDAVLGLAPAEVRI
jgi:PadR family transcriptional regulator, regulatory protein PadR